MRISRTVLAFLVLALAVAAQTAKADTITGTLTGTINYVNESTDRYGLFGPIGGSLLGDQLTLSFSYNTDLLAYTDLDFNDNGDYYSGEHVDAIAMEVTIGSYTYTYPVLPSSESVEDTFTNDMGNPMASQILFGVGSDDVEILSASTLPVGSLADQAAMSGFLGTVNLALVSIIPGEQAENIYFTPDASSTSTPEPTAWSLLGAGLCGLALLRRLQPSSFQSTRAR